MQVKLVKIDSLKPAKFNPKSRSSLKSIALRMLKKSIEKIGLIYPIAVDKDMNVIDGHRRLAACEALGFDDVPVIVVATDDLNDVYAEVNANCQRASGNETLQVWLKEPRAVTSRTDRMLSNYETIYGRQLMHKAANKGYSGRLFRMASSVAKYVGQEESAAFSRRVAEWLMRYRSISTVHAFIVLGQPPETLFKAVTRMKNLQPTYEVKK